MSYLEGNIYDGHGNLVKANGTIYLYVPGGTESAPDRITDGTFDGSYTLYTDWPENTFVDFAFDGYKKITLSYKDIADANGLIYLEKEVKPAPWIIAIVLIAVIAYRKKTNKVGAFSTADLFPIAILVGGVIGFDLIKKSLEGLGIWDSRDTKDLNEESSNPNSFWSPNYWQTVKPANKNWTYAINEQTALDWCKEIKDAFGVFNDNEEQAIAVFKRCRTKANCSFLAWVFQKYYNQDLLTYLRGGAWPQDRLSDADVNVINKYISNLPAY